MTLFFSDEREEWELVFLLRRDCFCRRMFLHFYRDVSSIFGSRRIEYSVTVFFCDFSVCSFEERDG